MIQKYLCSEGYTIDTEKMASKMYPAGAAIASFIFVPYRKGSLNVDVIAPGRLVPIDFIM